MAKKKRYDINEIDDEESYMLQVTISGVVLKRLLKLGLFKGILEPTALIRQILVELLTPKK